MSITLVNATVTAMVDALNRAPAVCPVVDRVRLRPVQQPLPQAVAVRPVQSEPKQSNVAGLPLAWETLVAVDLYVRTGAATAPDVAADELLSKVYARLMDDQTLGGAVLLLEPRGVSYDFDADGEQTACVSLVFSARSRAGTPFI